MIVEFIYIIIKSFYYFLQKFRAAKTKLNKK